MYDINKVKLQQQREPVLCYLWGSLQTKKVNSFHSASLQQDILMQVRRMNSNSDQWGGFYFLSHYQSDKLLDSERTDSFQ